MPPSRKLQRGPSTWASQPISGAPIGVPPAKTSMYRPMTRPLMSWSEASCTEELALVEKVSVRAPVGRSMKARAA